MKYEKNMVRYERYEANEYTRAKLIQREPTYTMFASPQETLRKIHLIHPMNCHIFLNLFAS